MLKTKLNIETLLNDNPELIEKLPNPFKILCDTFNFISENGRRTILELSKIGWYIDLSTLPKDLILVGEKISSNEIKFIDNYLSDYYIKSLDQIEYKLIEQFPNRTELFKESFQNYKDRRYFSSISLLFSLADGMTYEKTKKLYFRNNRNLSKNKIYKPEVEEVLQKISSGITEMFIGAILEPTLINDSIKNLDNYKYRLNRHEIYHGMNYKYGTSLNNLKVISFISYLNDMLKASNNN